MPNVEWAWAWGGLCVEVGGLHCHVAECVHSWVQGVLVVSTYFGLVYVQYFLKVL